MKYDEKNKNLAVSDEELENVSGGGCSESSESTNTDTTPKPKYKLQDQVLFESLWDFQPGIIQANVAEVKDNNGVYSYVLTWIFDKGYAGRCEFTEDQIIGLA